MTTRIVGILAGTAVIITGVIAGYSGIVILGMVMVFLIGSEW